MNDIRIEDTIDVGTTAGEPLRRFLGEQNISLKSNEIARIVELLRRNPTRVELHIFNVMWSEHCSYKSSRPLLKTLPTQAPHVVLGPGEDAGIVRLFESEGRSYCLVLAHESHNHPSQVLPVEGAATGIGGIVRDVYCMGADVIGVMDPLRFGDPGGVNGRRVREIVRGVVDGIAQYGNALGVPNYGGETYFHPSFDDNCLVNVVAIGIVEENRIIRSRAPEAAKQTTHDIILIGKPTDASGFGGAAFASERLSGDEAEERQEAVQVPDPFLKRVLAEANKAVLALAHRRGICVGFKDLGAGGIACAVSEMAQAGGVGASIDLDSVCKSPPSLPAEVVACSETQERYAMFVPTEFTRDVCKIYNEDFDLGHVYSGAGAYVIGRTTVEPRFQMRLDARLVCDAHVDVITAGIEYHREEKAPAPNVSSVDVGAMPSPPPVESALLELLSTYNLADKSVLYEHYDCEVQGRAVIRPGEADAAVGLAVAGEPVGVAASIGSNSALGELDPYLGGVWAVCEAARGVACVGGLPLAMTDCLNFGDPEDPFVFWQFAEAVRGIGDACRGLKLSGDTEHGVPIVSGNVSFYNQSGNGRPIAPTPIVACAGRVDDVSVCRDLGFKAVGSKMVVLGALHEALGGSEFALHFGWGPENVVPVPDFEVESALIRALIDGVREGLILAAHDIGHGGLLVTVAEMMMAAGPATTGCRLDVSGQVQPERAHASLFSEYGGVVVEVDCAQWDALRAIFEKHGAPSVVLGETTASGCLVVHGVGQDIDISLRRLRAAQCRDGKVSPLFA